MHERPPIRILLTGVNGQVGWELRRVLAPLGQVIAHDRASLDLTDLAMLREAVQVLRPGVIVNAAAYTAVDLAEAEPALAYRVNAEAPGVLAAAAAALGAVLIHFSTDYVFDGTASAPYIETDLAGPLNVYGASKLAGESAVLGAGATAYVLRLAWVYGMRGHNFLQTIRRMAAGSDGIRVVADQYGTPTWSRCAAGVTASLLGQVLDARRAGARPVDAGLYHVASADYTTWFGFAQEILRLMQRQGRECPRLQAITTADYPTVARRPAWSVLSPDRLRSRCGISLPSWKEQLQRCVASGAT